MSWISVAYGGYVSFPHKGSKVRIEPHMVATNASLAGMTDKIGVEVQEEVVGIVRHLYGDSVVEPTKIEIHIQTESGMKIVKLPASSIPHLQVEVKEWPTT